MNVLCPAEDRKDILLDTELQDGVAYTSGTNLQLNCKLVHLGHLHSTAGTDSQETDVLHHAIGDHSVVIFFGGWGASRHRVARAIN